MNKSILFITVTFPPRLSVASLRIYHYANLFQKHGWKVTVLTAAQFGEMKSSEFDLKHMEVVHVPWNDPFDKVLQIRNSLIRKICFKLYSFFIPYLATWYPDIRFISWRRNGIRLAESLIEKNQITYVFSSYSPPSPHLVASVLKKKFPQLYWIAEFRDLMSFSHSNKFWEYPLALLHNRFERKLLNKCNDILCVSKGHAIQLSKYLNRKVSVLYNGCDFEVYLSLKKIQQNRFTILYTGNIYKRRNDIDLFFKGLKTVIATSKNAITLLFLGTPKSSFLKNKISHYGLENFVEFIPKQNHALVRQYQKSANILLHFCWNKPNQQGNLTGKIFEYISARKPVLSIGHQNEVAEILEHTASGSTFKNPDRIADFILNQIQNPSELIQLNDTENKFSKLNQFLELEQRISKQ